MTVSGIYRTFKPTTGMFEVIAGDRTYTDDEITNITITRGSAGPDPTFTPSTVEFGLLGAVNIARNTPVRVRLVPAFASRLAAATSFTGSVIMHRFYGRKALTSTEDVRWKSGDAQPDWTTTVTCSSWTSLVKSAARSFSPSAGLYTASVLVPLLEHPDLTEFFNVTYAPLSKFDRLAHDDSQVTFADAADKYGDRLHTLIQHRRNGDVRVVPITQRHDDVAAPGPAWTLLRRHTLSPATWSSPSEAATTQYSVRYTTGSVPYTLEWPLGSDISLVPLTEELIDLEHITRDTESISLIMNSKNLHTNVSRQGVESVTIDLGLLWRMGDPSALRTIVEVLHLEAGSPLHLGGDWPQAVRGPYFADQIKEDVTPDSWTVTIELSHARYVLGLSDDDLPIPRPLTWDAARTTWNTTPGTWG